MKAEEKYAEMCATPSDINEHLPTVRKYVAEGDVVVELGVRNVVSTWALLANRPLQLISVDVVEPPQDKLLEVQEAAKEIGTDFTFIRNDSTIVSIEPIDVLFIDTLHLYSHLVKELARHAEKTRKYIIFHDSNIAEIRACIQDFLYNLNWRPEAIMYEGSGLTVLKWVGKQL